MSKRSRAQDASARKRIRKVVDTVTQGIGAPSEFDDDLNNSQTAPSATGLSTRDGTDSVPSLASIAIETFSENLRALDAKDPEYIQARLKALPPLMVPKVFSALSKTYPELLNSDLITKAFIRAPNVALSGELPGVNNATLRAVAELGANLRSLELSGLTKPDDQIFANIVNRVPQLEVLVLRGSTRVAIKTMQAISECQHLRVLNLNYTTPTPASLTGPLSKCLDLQVVKLAGIPKMTASTIITVLSDIIARSPTAGSNVTSLKLRQTGVNDNALSALLEHMPLLTRLDVSFTNVRSVPQDVIPRLEKLSFTSSPASMSFLKNVIVGINLRKLTLGALGENQSLTLTDSVLTELTAAVESLEHLEDMSLVANTKLGMTSARGNGALADFITRVGRRCKRLNLGGIPRLVSQDLYGLMDEGHGLLDDENAEGRPSLVSLTLSNTDVGDEAAEYIAACPHLESLALENTKITSEGLFTIIDACPKLTTLDLTSCRGVHVRDRRRFFEVWEHARGGGENQGRERQENNGRLRRSNRSL